MPEIIDNVRVGEIIKRLLKEHNMTQDDLANSLMISKSAVSQNLNGKSTFDIQNLINIAKIFNVSLDYLLDQTSNHDENIISEYERLTRKGLETLEKIPLDSLNLSKPDIYNKVFVQYVMQYKKNDMLNYLLEKKILLIDNTHHHALKVYIELIMYLLKLNHKDTFDYIKRYTELNNTFQIEEATLEETFWMELNQPKHDHLIRNLLYANSTKTHVVLRWFRYQTTQKLISLNTWVNICAKYKLDVVLSHLCDATSFLDGFTLIISTFTDAKYESGLLQYLKTLNPDFKTYTPVGADEVTLKIIQANYLEAFQIILEKGFYQNINKLLKYTLQEDFEAGFDLLIAKQNNKLSLKKAGLLCVQNNSLSYLEKIIHLLSQDEKEYLIAKANTKDLHILLFLFTNGARFNTRYYNHTTLDKANALIDHFTQKGNL